MATIVGFSGGGGGLPWCGGYAICEGPGLPNPCGGGDPG